MQKEIINTSSAPAAIGPYSQAIGLGSLVFTSGQIPINPDNGELESGDITTQTRRVLGNLKEVLSASGASLGSVVKTTVFLKSIEDFAKMNNVYSEYFNNEPPSRSCVQVSRLPKDVLVEIEAVAYKIDSK